MDMDEYIRRNPDFAKRYAKKDVKTNVKKDMKADKYECALCKRSFDKPKTAYLASFGVELLIYIAAIIGGSLLLGGLGLIVGVVIGFIFSIVRLCSRSKVCPHCGSKHFIKN